jgi:hypothetical protein
VNQTAASPGAAQIGVASTRAAKRRASWRQLVITRAARDRARLRATRVSERSALQDIEMLLERAESAAGQGTGLARWWTGSSQDLAWLSLHEAEALLIVLLSREELIAQAKDLLAKARALPITSDERVQAVEKGLDAPDEAAITHLARAVHGAWDERCAQSRGFRNRLIRLTVISMGALGLLMGAFATNAIPLDIKFLPSFVETAALVALFGAVGALIIAVPPLARAAGTWNPFSLPFYQLLLKVVLGPVFAIVGVMLLQSKLIPNIKFIKFSTDLPDLLTWGILFGAGQRTVTRVVDRRAADLTSGAPDDAQEPARRSEGSISR